MGYQITLPNTDKRIVCDVVDGELTGTEAIEDLEYYRDRVVLACNQAIAEIKGRQTSPIEAKPRQA